MNAEDEGGILEVDLSDWDGIVPEHWTSEDESDDDQKREVSEALPSDFAGWADTQREEWAWGDHDRLPSEMRLRRRLYSAWLTLHPEAELVHRSSAGDRTVCHDWLTNSVTPEAWDDTSHTTPPSVCRIDGTVGALFSAGRVSRMFGSSGSAKSWIAKLGTLEQLQAGGSVLYLDGDGVWQDFRDHMKALGLARDDALSGRLHYLRVEGSLLADQFRELLRSQAWTFIVFDGFNVVLNASGFKGAEDDGVTAFFGQVLNPTADTGAAVVVIDHMKKDGETDHGSVFKRNNLTGTDYAIKRMSLIAPGIRGYSSITLTAKDRPGWATSLHASRGRTQDVPFAFVVVDSSGDSGVATAINVQLDPPFDVLVSTAMVQASADADTLRALLKVHPGGFASNAKVRDSLKARKKDMDNNRINAAAAVLVAGGEATRSKVGQALDLRLPVKVSQS